MGLVAGWPVAFLKFLEHPYAHFGDLLIVDQVHRAPARYRHLVAPGEQEEGGKQDVGEPGFHGTNRGRKGRVRWTQVSGGGTVPAKHFAF